MCIYVFVVIFVFVHMWMCVCLCVCVCVMMMSVRAMMPALLVCLFDVHRGVASLLYALLLFEMMMLVTGQGNNFFLHQ